MDLREVFFPGEFQQFETFCSGTSVSKKCGRKSRKKGGRKSRKKGGRKSRKKGRGKSPKKGRRKSPKKGKKSVEAKRKSVYRRVLSQRRRKTIAAAEADEWEQQWERDWAQQWEWREHRGEPVVWLVNSGASVRINSKLIDYYYKLIELKAIPVKLTTHYVVGSGTPPDLKHVYLLLYHPDLFYGEWPWATPRAVVVEGAANRLDPGVVSGYLTDSNNDPSNCGDEGQKKPEYCGNCVISNNMVSLNLDNKLIGSVVNGRGTCQYQEHSNILWHTHPLTSRPWPSGEDIEKMIKSRPDIENDKIPVISLIFTKWGIWQIVVPMNGKGDIDKKTVENITNTGWQIFEEKWQRKAKPPAAPTCLNNFQDPIWRESIRNRVNIYTLTLAHYIPQLNPSINGGGFIMFDFWDKIAECGFAYHCYIPRQ